MTYTQKLKPIYMQEEACMQHHEKQYRILPREIFATSQFPKKRSVWVLSQLVFLLPTRFHIMLSMFSFNEVPLPTLEVLS